MEKFNHAVRYMIRFILLSSLVFLVIFLVKTAVSSASSGNGSNHSLDLLYLLNAIPVIDLISSILSNHKEEYRSQYDITVEQAPRLPDGSIYDSFHQDNDVTVTSVYLPDGNSQGFADAKYYTIFLDASDSKPSSCVFIPFELHFHTCPPGTHVIFKNIRIAFSEDQRVIRKLSDIRAFPINSDFRINQKVLIRFAIKCTPELEKKLLHSFVTIHMHLTFFSEGHPEVTEYFYVSGGQDVNHLTIMESHSNFSWLKYYRYDNPSLRTLPKDLVGILKDHLPSCP